MMNIVTDSLILLYKKITTRIEAQEERVEIKKRELAHAEGKLQAHKVDLALLESVLKDTIKEENS